MIEAQKKQHLYWRAGFGCSPQLWEQQKNRSTKQCVQQLFKEASQIKPVPVPAIERPSFKELKALSPKERRELQKNYRKGVKTVNYNWMMQMIEGKNSPLLDKMTFFWHGHFACESKRFDFAAHQINTIQQHALGNFRDLVVAISKDAAMIMYLNNQQNRKKHPNENYARELMELFTIGRGNYTEQDVKEAARAFTGWFTNRLTGVFDFRERQHDTGSKTFMGKTGNWNGDDIIDFLLEKKETAHFIATKVYRFFVNETIQADQVEVLANALYQSNYNIKTMMQTLLNSDWFYDKQHIGTQIKSPVVLLVSLFQSLGVRPENEKTMLFLQHALGQVLLNPPNVAGWPGGKAWVDNASLLLRMNLVAYIFDQGDLNIELKDQPEMSRPKGPKKLKLNLNLNALEKIFKKATESELDQAVGDYLLQVTFQVKQSFLDQWLGATTNRKERFKLLVLGLMSLPEYQLC